MVHNAELNSANSNDESYSVLAGKSEALREALLVRKRQIEESLNAMDAEIADIQQEMSRTVNEVLKRRHPVEEALTHLDAFLRVEGWLPPNQSEKRVPCGAGVNSKASMGAAHELLNSLGQPVHYRELAQRLSEKGIRLAGKDPAATLLSQMTRDGRFKRCGRGIYGLSSWKLGSLTRPRKKRRKHGSKTQS